MITEQRVISSSVGFFLRKRVDHLMYRLCSAAEFNFINCVVPYFAVESSEIVSEIRWHYEPLA